MTDILSLVEGSFETLSPQLQVAARYILSSPDEVALYSMRKIAERAAVKPATMLRLANKLGFENYNDLRETFRDRISDPVTGYVARARKLQLRQSGNSKASLAKDLMMADRDNIDRTFATITDEKLFAVADAFIDAHKVHIIGLRKCTAVACFFHYATRIFFPNARLITGGAGSFSEELCHIAEADVLIAIAFDPYTHETVKAAKHAFEKGARLVVITDSVVSPLSRNADHLFIAANRSPSFYRSLAGAMSIAQALVAAIVTRLGEGALTALEQSDKNLRETHTYWQG